MDILEELRARQGHRKILGKRLMNKEISLLEACEEDPMLLFEYKKIKANLLEYNLDKHNAVPDLLDFEFHDGTPYKLAPLTEKKKHYWFHSSMPNRGKTTFLKDMASVARCSWYSTEELY